MPPLSHPCPTVAIVGGGASGSLVAVHLLRELAGTGRTARILLVDRDGRHGLGRAYGTPDHRHLLNVPAAGMSALAGDAGHFAAWAGQRHGAAGTDFLPRQQYGRYLRDTLAEAERVAGPTVELHRLTADVDLVAPPVGGGPAAIRTDREWHSCDAVVLATGNPPATPIPPRRPVDGVLQIGDPWSPGALRQLHRCTNVLVVGCGLTMVDLAVTLCASPGVTVHAVSRSGLLPRAHHDIAGPAVDLDLPAGA